VPGPACYGLGGEEVTVTDADLVLGFLNAEYFLGGKMRLHAVRAEQAIGRLAQQLHMDVERAAWGMRQLVDENMASAARVHAAERGIDIRPYTLVATGGAGPVHACGLAQRLGIDTVVVPPGAGVGSAFGLQLAPIAFDFARTYVVRLEEMDAVRVGGLLAEMEEEGRRIVAAAGVAPEEVRVARTADMRYVGQGHEIRVALADGALGGQSSQQLQQTFDGEYRRLFGRLCDGVPVEAVNWRVYVSSPRPDPQQVQVLQDAGVRAEGELKGRRAVLFEPVDARIDTPVFNRYGLRRGFVVDGPAIVEEAESTTVVPPAWHLEVDEVLSLILTRRGI
jgi:N-methylhydantoinase A